MCRYGLPAPFSRWCENRLKASGHIASIRRVYWQLIDTFLWRNKKCGLCQSDLPPFQELCEATNEQLSDKILLNKQHLLHYLLPPPSAASLSYNIRRRLHSQLLPQHPGHLMDSNFMIRMLYKNIYWLFCDDYVYTCTVTLKLLSLGLHVLSSLHFDKLIIKRIYDIQCFCYQKQWMILTRLVCHYRYLAAAKQQFHLLFVVVGRCEHVRPATGSVGTGDHWRHRDRRRCHVLIFLSHSRYTVQLDGGWETVCTDWHGSTLSHRYRMDSGQSPGFRSVAGSLFRVMHTLRLYWVMRSWHCYLSGARCKWFACGPSDATATPSSLASL